MTEISKVIITGGRETGGIQSYATTLARGFGELGMAAEVIPPAAIFSRTRDLRDENILKILSTTAVFVAPIAKRTICIAHGIPRADAQGWPVTLGVLSSLKLASVSKNCVLIAVSHYTASNLKALYNIRAGAVIHNPLKDIFLSTTPENGARQYLTYVGRLHPAKNVDRLLPPMQTVLDDCPGFRICIVGSGKLRNSLYERFGGDSRIEFTGGLDDNAMREVLRKTAVFISGNEVEGFGIAYLEALSQGCSVVMPACGGGLEIAPGLIGTQVQLMPLSFDIEGVKGAIRRGLDHSGLPAPVQHFSAKTVAGNYLEFAGNI